MYNVKPIEKKNILINNIEEEIIELEEKPGLNVALKLRNYDEIFSDFDRRPIKDRSLSEDFLYYCQTHITEQLKNADIDGTTEVSFLIPQDQRNPLIEPEIKYRLKNHFQYRLTKEKKKRSKYHISLWKFGIIGAILLIIASLTQFFTDRKCDSEKPTTNSFILSIVNTLIQPILQSIGGIFVWVAGEPMVYRMDYKERYQKDYKFFKKMTQFDLNFCGSSIC